MTAKHSSGELQRSLDWKSAFWVAAGIPPIVLYSIGGISGVAGKAAFIVWIISITMGFLQSFTYAEMATMFANKSGGASVYGATAWLRYSKMIAPLSVWCNWFAWSPALSVASIIAAGYILNAIYPIPAATSPMVLEWIAMHAPLLSPGDPRVVAWLTEHPGLSADEAIKTLLSADGIATLTPPIRKWEAFSIGIPGIGLLHFNATFFVGATIMSIIFLIQHGHISSTALTQKILAIIVLIPLFLAGIVPILTGVIDSSNVTSIVPPSAVGAAENGSWNNGGWTLFLGGLYVAAWSTYGFETAVCYTRELKNPRTDTFKAIFFSGLVCILFFTLIPYSFQGVLGHTGMIAPQVLDGTGIAEILGRMVGNYKIIIDIFTVLMVLGMVLAIMTAMAGSSRTLYQASRDGWLPKYLGRVNKNGAPTGAMWTDFSFNIFLLGLASDTVGYYYVIAISNVGYIIFNFLNLNAGWIHRIDSGHIKRHWKAPTFLIGLNTVLAFVNALFLGAGAKVWGYSNALWHGLIFSALIIPVFYYRHYIQDSGKFPADALAELGLSDGDTGEKKAGILPYLALLLGAAIVFWADWFFVLPH